MNIDSQENCQSPTVRNFTASAENIQATKPKKKRRSKLDKVQFICDFCNIILPVEASIEEHLFGKDHRSRDSPELMRRRLEQGCGMYVLGIPNTISHDMILKYFAKCGRIVWVHFENEFLLIDYSEPASVTRAVEGCRFLDGKRIYPKYRNLKTHFPKEEAKDVIEKLNGIPKFDDQVCILQSILQPNPQTEKYLKISQDLYTVVSSEFPNSSIHSFGSSVTGLDFADSDLDVHISGVNVNQDDETYLEIIQNLLSESGQFTITSLIIAKVPVLKCVHVETGTNCDINVKNMLSVCNSSLIKYYLRIDSKIHSLMMILKCWAKLHEVIGEIDSFNSYTLYMMIIFFLQQPPFNFPSVIELKKNMQITTSQGGWECGFQPIVVKDTPVRTTS